MDFKEDVEYRISTDEEINQIKDKINEEIKKGYRTGASLCLLNNNRMIKIKTTYSWYIPTKF